MLMKLLLKSVMVLVILAGLGTYLSYLTTGRLPFDLAGLMSKARQAAKPFQGETVSAPEVEGTEGEATVLRAGKIRVYKWQDAMGQWHYGSQPPEDTANVQSMVLDREQNVVAGLRPPPEEPRPEAEDGDSARPQAQPPEGSAYSPEKIEQLFKDAQNIQKTLEGRYQTQQELLNR